MVAISKKVGRPSIDASKKLVGVKVMLPPDLAEWARLNKGRVSKHKLLAAELEKMRLVLALSI